MLIELYIQHLPSLGGYLTDGYGNISLGPTQCFLEHLADAETNLIVAKVKFPDKERGGGGKPPKYAPSGSLTPQQVKDRFEKAVEYHSRKKDDMDRVKLDDGYRLGVKANWKEAYYAR